MLGASTVSNIRRARDACNAYLLKKPQYMDMDISELLSLQRDIRCMLCGMDPNSCKFPVDIRMPGEKSAIEGSILNSDWFMQMRDHAEALLS